MLFAILTFTRASICATITAVVPEPGGVTVIVGCVKYLEPAFVIVTLVTEPLVTFAVAAACVPPDEGADIVRGKSPLYPVPALLIIKLNI